MHDRDFKAFRVALGRCYVAAGVEGEALFRLGSDNVARLWFVALQPHPLYEVIDAMERVAGSGQDFVPVVVIGALTATAPSLLDISAELRRIAKGEGESQ